MYRFTQLQPISKLLKFERQKLISLLNGANFYTTVFIQNGTSF